jgi:uncharacterized protein YbbK (DUF523 family)
MEALLHKHICIPVCPEQMGGLPTPRPPAERRGEGIFTVDGADVTAAYQRGAEAALELAKLYGCEAAVLKERSPSCGRGTIHDGTFSGGITAGDGVTSARLEAGGIPVYGESKIGELLR